VARGTQHRKRSPQADARVAPPEPKKPKKAKKPKHANWEDQLFFSRLRSHAKWVFVLLALFFGLGFVLFGVGTGTGGIGDVFPDLFSRTSNGPSVSSLQERVQERPKDAEAWHELSTALQQDSDRLDEAIAALTRYTELRPKDDSALQELGGLYLRRADEQAVVYQTAQARTQSYAPGEPFKPAAASPLVNLYQDPLSSAITSLSETTLAEAYSGYLDAQQKAVDIYKKIVALRPKDATFQFRLAQVAQGSGDSTTAIAAYKKFLELAPNDSYAPVAKQALKQLTATPAATAGGG
jgi:tetratricopeptide (TPR) repeat protein